MSATATPQRVLAIDFGDRRTGLAATDYTGTIRFPLDALKGLDDAACAKAIAELVIERETQVLVLGLPVERDGGEGPRAKRTREFQKVLAAATACPIEVVDESMTTDEAHRRLKSIGIKAARRKLVVDSVSAVVILERYLTGG